MIKDSTVTVMVGNMEGAIKFYVETLGLRLVANYGGHYAEIAAPGLKIGLHPAGKQAPGQSGGMSIGFGVENLDETVSELKKKGISFSEIVDDGPVRLAHFADADGNPLYLAQQKKW